MQLRLSGKQTYFLKGQLRSSDREKAVKVHRKNDSHTPLSAMLKPSAMLTTLEDIGLTLALPPDVFSPVSPLPVSILN